MNKQSDIVERLKAEPTYPANAIEAVGEIERLRGIVQRVTELAEREWPRNRKTYPTGDELARAAFRAIELCEQELLNAIYGEDAPVLCWECGT